MDTLSAERRVRNHLLIGLGVLSTLGVAAMVGADGGTADRLSIVSAYQCLFLLGAALLIGPIKAWDRGRPVGNSHTRRDVGIWAGITALLHFFLANVLAMNYTYLEVFVDNASRPPDAAARMQLYTTGTILGYVVAVVFLLLMLLSSDFMLRKFGMRWWKRLQRLSYVVFAATVVHAFAFQILESRPRRWIAVVTLVTLCIALAQLGGMAAVRRGPLQLRSKTPLRKK